jgi:hypothetical protein
MKNLVATIAIIALIVITPRTRDEAAALIVNIALSLMQLSVAIDGYWYDAGGYDAGYVEPYYPNERASHGPAGSRLPDVKA